MVVEVLSEEARLVVTAVVLVVASEEEAFLEAVLEVTGNVN
jgi:hypothetical protein